MTIGREEFLKVCMGMERRVRRTSIINQLKKLGASADWEQRALYHGRRLLQSSTGSLYQAV